MRLLGQSLQPVIMRQRLAVVAAGWERPTGLLVIGIPLAPNSANRPLAHAGFRLT